MSFFGSFLLSILFYLAACSCQIPTAEPALSEDEPRISLMTWNVQNLFDAESGGNEYREYDPEQSDWDEAKLRIRLENLKEVIQSVGENGPDIILLQEVENLSLLDQLNSEYLEELYPYRGVWEYTENSIHCGYLSRITPVNVHLHFPGDFGSFPLRAIVELRFQLEGEDIVIFNNHWKSRSGGTMATEKGRLQSARAVAERLKELKAQGVSHIIVAGDLNGSCDDYREGGRQTAQIPIEQALDTEWMDSLFVAESPEDLAVLEGRPVLYSPWERTGDEGSYFFQNRWMKLDHFLLTSAFLDGEGWELESADCLNEAWLSDADGLPLAWKSWTGSGYSDHFPLILKLTKIADTDSDNVEF